MFATATKSFSEEVDPDGSLIPMSSLKDSVVVMSVVVKRKKFWLWQKPKYIPTDFKITDLLTGDTPLTPGEMKEWCVTVVVVVVVVESSSSKIHISTIHFTPQ